MAAMLAGVTDRVDGTAGMGSSFVFFSQEAIKNKPIPNRINALRAIKPLRGRINALRAINDFVFITDCFLISNF